VIFLAFNPAPTAFRDAPLLALTKTPFAKGPGSRARVG